MKTHIYWGLAILTMLLNPGLPIHAQLVADGTTATINATSTNLTGDVIIGTNGSFTMLILTNAAAVTNSGNGVISQNASAMTNHVLVTGANSIWSITGNLNLGAQGDYGRLTVTNGGRIHNNFGNMALNNTSAGNVAIVTGANSLWTNRGNLNIGNGGSFNQVFVSNSAVVGVFGKVTVGNASASSNLLWVASGGTVLSDSGTLGLNGSVRGNVAVIKDADSRWTTKSVLEVGPVGAFNQLYVTNGAEVFSAGAYVGANIINSANGQTNLAVLTGIGSTWTNTASAGIGGFGSFNQLIISNGATMRHTGLAGGMVLGSQPTGSNNTLLVTGTNSLFSNRGLNAKLEIGRSGSFNQLQVRNGGVVETDTGQLGTLSGSNNLALACDPGSLWMNAIRLEIGQGSSFNLLIVSNGATVIAADLPVGHPNLDSIGNAIILSGGSLIVTNASSTAHTFLTPGAFTLDGGLLRSDRITSTSPNPFISQFTFDGGTVQTGNATISNGSAFQVGNGISSATLELLGNGTHSFADGLRIANNSALKGSGTISGGVTNLSGGTISPGASIGKLTLSNSPSLQGNIFMEVSRSGIILTSDQIQVLSNLTYAGTLTVTNIGPDELGLGDQFLLFDAPGFVGSFANITLPVLASGLAWTNKLSVDGTIEVVAGPVPTLYVTNMASLGPGTLRQALSDNLALGGGYTVLFSSNLSGTITLSGELSVLAPVLIRGPGTNIISVSGNNLSRIFTVATGPTLISGLTIRNGRVTGGDGNQMQDGDDAHGGAIWNSGTLTISNCLVISNSVVGGNGGPSGMGNVGNGGNAFGGAVYNNGGTLTLLSSVFARNRVEGGAGGNASGGGGSTVGFGGEAYGGAIASVSGTNRSVRCDYLGNTAQGGNGGIAGGSNPGGTGGPAFGGALYNIAEASVAFSTFRDGLTTGGNSTFGGLAGSAFGGAIANFSTLVIHSSTIASNRVGGTSVTRWGGGIYNGSDLGLTNCTVAWNQADVGGGVYGSAVMGNTILAGNSAGTGPDANGILTSLDYNLIQSTAGTTIGGVTTHNLTGVNPLLGSLQTQPGAAPTLPLLAGSPAIDQGKSFGLLTDQRGILRPYDLASVANAAGGDGTDIGAFEFLPAPQLNIALVSSTDVALFWSTDAADYLLESSPMLPPAASWTEVVDQRITIGSQVFVTNSATAAGQYYRLRFFPTPGPL